MTAIEMISRERDEQIKVHGFTLDHDLETNKDGELLKAAVYLITGEEETYPKTWDRRAKQIFDEKTSLEKYTVAAALIAAHIDLLQNIKQNDKITK